MSHDALEYPENYLWVRRNGDGTGWVIDLDRLAKLANSATPQDDTEKVLVADPEWLRVYLTHVIGNYPVTIPAGGPRPEWDSVWLKSVE